MPPPEVERAVGIECYATDGAPCSASVKTTPEDFLVEEQVILEGLVQEARPGYFPLYRVEKRSVDTMHMARELSEALRSRVSYAGLKDKKAVAVQYATPRSRRAEQPSKVNGRNFTASLVGYVPERLSRKALAGNRFAVVIRECCTEIELRIKEAVEMAESRRLPNFYGLQRFGAFASGTHLIGREMVKAQFEAAVNRMLVSGLQPDSRNRRMIEDAVRSERYGEVAELLPLGMDSERMVARELSRHPANWIRAIRAVPIQLRRLYVQAYQSYVFNKTVSKALKGGEDISSTKRGDNWAPVSEDGLVTSSVKGARDAPTSASVPMVQLVGYAYRDYGSRFDSMIKEVLNEEEIEPGQFYVEKMQEVSSEGGFRRPHLAIRDASWNAVDRTAKMKFILGKGQYATILLREIIKPRFPTASGLA